ncbi:MAG TPA: hypothetical protein VGS10_07345 [Terracidiphilus sp.]|nr:hypothetical protein [Terracidiphilus sp.]
MNSQIRYLVSFSSLAAIDPPASFVRSLDSSLRNDFQQWRDMFFFWLSFSTGAVLVGVILEEIEEIKGIPESAGKWLAKIGWLLIIVGVLGEGVFEGLLSKADGWIETLDSSLLTAAQLTADSNELEVGYANEAAAAAQARLLELQRGTLPRTFNIKRVASKLARFRGTTFALMTLSDFEPSHTAAMIVEALKEAKWNRLASGTSGGAPNVLSLPGIWIVSTTSDKRAAQALALALGEEGVEAHTRPYGEEERSAITIGQGDVEVFVGLRPMPGMPSDLRVVSATK